MPKKARPFCLFQQTGGRRKRGGGARRARRSGEKRREARRARRARRSGEKRREAEIKGAREAAARREAEIKGARGALGALGVRNEIRRTSFFSRRNQKAAFTKTADKVFFSGWLKICLQEKEFAASIARREFFFHINCFCTYSGHFFGLASDSLPRCE